MNKQKSFGHSKNEDNFVAVDYNEKDFGTLNLSRKVVIKSYAPKTFQRIRQLCNIQDKHVLESLEPSKNIRQIQNAGLGAGASGSFFFFSSDKRFILKTMNETEVNHMLRVLGRYHTYMEENRSSFIAKMFGMYTVRIAKFEPIHVMVMQNTMPNIENTELNYVFDMKGSSINREVLKKKKNSELKEPTGG
mmetsp:Transcript_29894/g.45707  ORF Transcript_29894/g.45707 Transcript_29894/m.45707 type:complete len:191 (+) Transcript_29894:1507-2079(+)